MPDGHVSFLLLAEAIDQLLAAISGDSMARDSMSRRSQRTIKNLELQSQLLAEVGTIPTVGFRRSDWAVGQQSVVVVPVLTNILQQRGTVAASYRDRCLQRTSELASQLAAVAEGRPSEP